MRKTFFIVFVFGVVKYSHSQFLTTGSAKKITKTCDSSVEHFFNVIFTEFQSTSPVCVCVQMCLNQPTYCYPNGCLKRAARNKKDGDSLPMTRITANTKSILLLHKEKNDFMNDFLTKNYVDDNFNIPMVDRIPAQSETALAANMRPDPFKGRYKILFKYKKKPKVELKYNFGKRVKKMKSDVSIKKQSVDISKTRWPMNKFSRRMGGQQFVQNKSQVQISTTNPRYFMTMFPPKYFKRELHKNKNNEDYGEDIKAMYVVGNPELESSAFSLKKLIDSLVENSFDKNATPPDSGARSKTLVNQSIIQIEEPNNAAKENSPKRSVKNETTNIISMNLTNESVDKNKYLDDNINNANNREMIATLYKRIEIQNNTSSEMREITGNFDFELLNTISKKHIETTLHKNTEPLTTEYSPMVNETRTTIKIRRRVARRLKHNKIM